MGLFLQTAIIPDCEVWEVQEAVKNVEEWLDTLDSAQCSYRRLEHGCMVLFNEDCFGYEELAVELRRVGFPKRDDGRIRWEGFPEDFLEFLTAAMSR